MLIPILIQLFERDLNRLKVEIDSYTDEKTLWLIEKSISNSAGNLCLHLLGNLNTYIGAELGKTNYVRNRPLEFSQKNVPKIELLHQIDTTLQIVVGSLQRVSEESLLKEYPLLVFEQKTSTAFFLVHLTSHLAYHLGQINYHRRLLDR